MAGTTTRLEILNALYRVYENHSVGYENACSRGCSYCCTRNVTLTSLEAKNIVSNINSDMKNAVINRIETSIHQKRFIPKVTINQMAKMCIEGKELPEEENDPAWGSCPLLEDNTCLIYDVRPFACRCMVSGKKCDSLDGAHMESYLVSLNNLFIQYIEHIDQGGMYGNLSDVILFEAGNDDKKNLLANYSVEMLMVPPEHQVMIMNVVEEIQVSGRELERRGKNH